MFLTQDLRGAGDDFWYEPTGLVTASGQRVSPDHALRLTAVFSCVKVLSETVAQLPLFLYRYLEDDGKEKAKNHPLFRLLHRRPNKWQTSYEWREMMQAHATLRGNGYSEIITAPNGRILELIPLHPDRVEIDMLSETRWRYIYTDLSGRKRTILSDEMFHLRGLSFDGVEGVNPIEYERESLGLSLAAQDYGSRFYQNGANPGGVIEYDGKFKTDIDRREFRASWQESQAGMNRHKTAVLEHGMKYKELGIKHTDAQYLETRKYQNEEIARIFRVPLHKIQNLDRATFNNIESLSISFVVDTMMPWFVRWEQAISRDLIVREDEYFAEFLVDGLLRGDSKARAEYYASGITNGWLARNEARVKENLNKKPGLDEHLEPLNMTRASDRNQSREDDLTMGAAQRIVKKEVMAMRKLTKNPETLIEKIEKFYSNHAGYVSSVLVIPLNDSISYVERTKSELLAVAEKDIKSVLNLLDKWEEKKSFELVKLGT